MNSFKSFLTMIESLPSAQPQLPEWAKKAEEYRQSAPRYIHNPLTWALYQVWKEIEVNRMNDVISRQAAIEARCNR